MSADRQSDFLARARELWEAAAVLRARGVAEGDPALGVWREAAWCHLLWDSGHFAAVVTRLRAVGREVAGVPPSAVAIVPADEAATASAAADLFALLRAAVTARHPTAFGLTAAA